MLLVSFSLSSYCSLEIHEIAGAPEDILHYEVTLKIEGMC